MRAVMQMTLSAVVAATGVADVAPLRAQEYPTKPVRIVAGAIGSGSDFASRYVGQGLSEHWGKPVVVDNRSTIISAEHVMHAAADGHTLLMGQLSSHATAPSVYKNLSYDPVKDFAPITLVTVSPLVLIAHPSVPGTNLREFIEYARQQPGAVRFAAQSGASGGRLTMELFNRAAGVEALYVPYKSPTGSLNAILGQEAQVSFLTVQVSLPQLNARKVKAYAITSAKRFPAAADIATMAEAGLPGVESYGWFGLFGPARTPQFIVQKVTRDVASILRSPEAQAALLAHGMEATPSTPEEFAAFISSEIAKWRTVIRTAGIRAE